MDNVILLIYCTTVVIIFVIFANFLCGCGKSKATVPPTPEEGANPAEPVGPSAKTDSPSFISTGEVFDLNPGKRTSARVSGGIGGGASVVGIPKLPPKGEEVDVPLPKAAQGKKFRSGPRPKKVPKPGMTAPVRPVDDDPTMPVEDDTQAYKMATKNKSVAPLKPIPPPGGSAQPKA